jgi:DNA-binding beta-propeller fold protein YncE
MVDQEYQHNQAFDSANAEQATYELTVDDLALHDRYADASRTKIINLQAKDETQPVDVRIHQDTKKIYLCDIGRSVIEIYDFNGTFKHMISDGNLTKFKPTAIAIAFDGTIIIASYFSHYLQMHAPNLSASTENTYSYKVFKLGSPGIYIHQFQHPAGIAIDNSDGFLYVCDPGNSRIQVINPGGVCERVIELFYNSKKKYQLEPTRIAHQKKTDQVVCIVGTGDALCFIPKHANG